MINVSSPGSGGSKILYEDYLLATPTYSLANILDLSKHNVIDIYAQFTAPSAAGLSPHIKKSDGLNIFSSMRGSLASVAGLNISGQLVENQGSGIVSSIYFTHSEQLYNNSHGVFNIKFVHVVDGSNSGLFIIVDAMFMANGKYIYNKQMDFGLFNSSYTLSDFIQKAEIYSGNATYGPSGFIKILGY